MADTESERKDNAAPAGISVEGAKDVLGELVVRAAYGGERIIVTRYGKPIAAIVGLGDLARIEGAAA